LISHWILLSLSKWDNIFHGKKRETKSNEKQKQEQEIHLWSSWLQDKKIEKKGVLLEWPLLSRDSNSSICTCSILGWWSLERIEFKDHWFFFSCFFFVRRRLRSMMILHPNPM
jgi:hypothetical protein